MSASRFKRYVPLARDFSARVVLFHEAVAEVVGLHVTDVKVLRLLGDESMTAGQLVEGTGLTGAAVTALTDRLVAAGYVTRERDDVDRRRVTIRGVPAKVRTLDQVYEDYGAEMVRLLARYSEAEYAVLESYLKDATQLLTKHAMKLRGGTRNHRGSRS